MTPADNNRGNYFEKRAGTDDARYHVVTGEDARWEVKKEGEREAIFETNDKDEAIEEASKRAEEAETKVIVHGQDGQIEDQIEFDQ
ncbi:hypothetical protein SAMN04488100_10341 [Alkalibacterium putridalgicola]|uniref:DUF2188 domain-containing protein n=1 Tax=Alkalibacterium putridalgicola TaxID=426703 RepID=A0A1H7QZY4_9LACT|nr:DUF2188 domain-containing protein [Alkalibacterium putridalgicola]GEK89006.1 hypothetical protein APU01nite_10450 [Alkalibacterium putridalgicola]SEL53298.1 hypothetical protein SAMN04488100_10341 [Alkalibacterium putridalgicola]